MELIRRAHLETPSCKEKASQHKEVSTHFRIVNLRCSENNMFLKLTMKHVLKQKLEVRGHPQRTVSGQITF